MTNYQEIEAKFYYINKDEYRAKLKQVGAQCMKTEQLYRRSIFKPIEGLSTIQGNYARVRDEGDSIRMSIKTHALHGSSMLESKEIELEVSSFEIAEDFLKSLNLKKSAYQETFREVWKLEDAEITIDTWPWLDTYTEIESHSEEHIWKIARLLEVDQMDHTIDAVTYLYSQKYDISHEVVNNYPIITFNEACPWSVA